MWRLWMRHCDQGPHAEPAMPAWPVARGLGGGSVLLDHGPRKRPLHARGAAHRQLDGQYITDGQRGRADRSCDHGTIRSGVGDGDHRGQDATAVLLQVKRDAGRGARFVAHRVEVADRPGLVDNVNDLVAGDRLEIRATGAYTTTYSAVAFNGFEPLKCYCI